jgi:hypothetical protein
MGSGILALSFALLCSVLFSDLFNVALSMSDYLASNGKKINERPVGNDTKGSVRSQFQGTIPNFSRTESRKQRESSFRISKVQWE